MTLAFKWRLKNLKKFANEFFLVFTRFKFQEADRLASTKQGTVSSGQLTQSALDDLLSLGVGELVTGTDQPSSSSTWGNIGMVDPWGVPQPSGKHDLPSNNDLFSTGSPNNDPWSSGPATQLSAQRFAGSSDPFASWDTPNIAPAVPSINSVDLIGGDVRKMQNTSTHINLKIQLLSPTTSLPAVTTNSTNGTRKTPENFLGENSNLVNLDNLLGTTSSVQNGRYNKKVI